MKPTLSVIIPVRNGERTLARAIDSALGQRFDGAIEVVVANDGSTDSTADVMRRYEGRIAAVHDSWSSVSAARNAGVRVSHGDYLTFLDADDEWLPERFARSVPLFEQDPECAMVYHDAVEVDRAGRVLKTSYYPEGFDSVPTLEDLLSGSWRGLPILVGTVVMRRSVFERVGGFREDLTACEDVCLWIFAREQGPFRYVPESLLRREFEFNPHRERWYIEGACALDRLLRERFGRRVAGNIPLPILTWFGTEAMLRGDRARARKHYLAALRLRPARLRTWARLISTTLPKSATEKFERVMRGRPGQRSRPADDWNREPAAPAGGQAQ
jgi:glycosyltransferase involved in cell wall biosynthesis